MSSSAATLTENLAPSGEGGKLSRTVAYFAAFIALGLVSASLGPTLPGLADHTGTRLSGISFLFTARSLGYLIGAFQGGRLFDRVSGHPVMAAVLFSMALLMALAPVMSLLWLLVVVLLLLGITEGVLDVGGNTLLVWTHGERVGPFMNSLHFFFGVGALLSPVIIERAISASGDITRAYWILAGMILPVGVWMLCLPRRRVWAGSKDNQSVKVDYLLVALIALFFLIYVGAEVSFSGWVFTYAVAMKLGDERWASYLTSAFWGALTLGRLLAIPLAMRFRPRTILFGDLVGGIVSLSVVLWWSHSLTALWAGTLGMGLSMASVFPTTLALAKRRIVITGRITGLFFAGASGGGMSLPLLIGQLFESRGPQSTMLVILADLLAAVGVLVILLLYSSGRAANRKPER